MKQIAANLCRIWRVCDINQDKPDHLQGMIKGAIALAERWIDENRVSPYRIIVRRIC